MRSKLFFLFLIPYLFQAQNLWQATWGPNYQSTDYFHLSGNSLYMIAAQVPYKSTDGEHWQIMSNIPAGHQITYITSSGSRLYLLGYDEVLYSDNQGSKWTQDTLKGIMSSYINGNELFFASYHHLYYSPDQGKTWQYIRAHDFIIGMSYFQNQFYLCDNKGNLYKSTDKGKTLQQITNPGQSTSLGFYGIGTPKDNVLLNDHDNFLYILGGIGLHRMNGNGFWTDISPTGPSPSMGAAYNVRVDSNTIYLAGMDSYCYTSNKNTIAWNRIKIKYYALDFISFQNKLLTSGTHGVRFTMNNTLIWQKAYHNIYCGTWGINMYADGNELWSDGWKSSDYGDNWSAYPYIDSLTVLKKHGSIAVAEQPLTHQTYITSNNGITWKLFSVSTLTSVQGYEIHKQIVFAGGYSGGTYRSTDLGNTWQKVHAEFINSFVDLDSLLFMTTDDNLYKSDDDGQHWQTVNYGMASTPEPPWIINAGGALYCQTISSPKFRSVNNGTTWKKLTENGLNVTMRTCIAATNNSVFVSGYDYGAFGGEIRQGIYVLTLGDTAWHIFDPHVSTDRMLVHGNYLFAAFGSKGIERLQLGPDPQVSVKEAFNEAQLVSFPNPCDGQLTVLCPESLQRPVQLYNMQGEVVLTQSSSGQMRSIQLSTKELKDGIYFIKYDHYASKILVVH